jgi:hypothetical protein
MWVIELLSKLVGLLKDGPELFHRWRKELPAQASAYFDDPRIRGVTVIVRGAEFRVSEDGGSLALDLQIINPTKRDVKLDQVRVDYFRVNSYNLLDAAKFIPATGGARPRSIGLGRFDYRFDASTVKQFRSGLKVAPNRQSSPCCDIDGHAEYHFISGRKQLRTGGAITVRNALVSVIGPGPDGAL